MALTSGAISLTSNSTTSIVLAGAIATGGSGTYTYQWIRSSDGGSTWSNISGATTATSVTDSTVVANTGYYYRLKTTDTGVSPNTVTTSNTVYTVATTEFSAASSSPYSTLLDYVGGTNPIYVGESMPGSASSTASWRIKKLTYDGNNNPTVIAYAGGNTGFTNIWDNRASLTYS